MQYRVRCQGTRRLLHRLHVAHKNKTKIEMIYNHITPKIHIDTNMCNIEKI